MNETLKKLTAEIQAALAERAKSAEWQDFFAKTKVAEDAGSFEVVISTDNIDRQGESIDQNGWDLAFYHTNPIVLWAHDYYALPIGVADEIKVENGRLIARGRFAAESANPFAQQVRRLYDLKIVRATSVGFIVKESTGGKITKAELLEFSFVPVPANPFALSLRKAQELGLDTAMLAMKGISVKAEGDMCTMDDGTEGMMKPNAEGALVCMPKVEEKPEVTENYIRIPVKDGANYDPESIRTIDIDAEKGIKALSACPKGSYEGGKCSVGTEVITYLFDKDKWNEADAQAWVDEHKKAEKGAVADEVAMDNAREQKWQKLDPIMDIIDAFFCLFLDEQTPIEQFDALLAETAALLQVQVGAGTQPTQASVAGYKGTGAIKRAEKTDEPNGTGEHPNKQEPSEEKPAAPTATEQGGEGEELPEGVAPEQRSNGTGYTEKELVEFFQTRDVLRLINTVTSTALAQIKKRGRSSKTNGS